MNWQGRLAEASVSMRAAAAGSRITQRRVDERYSSTVLSVAATMVLSFMPLGASQTATCRSVALDPVRTWRIERTGALWQVSHWRGPIVTDVARVSLPASADVRLSATALHVRAKTSNGGIDVTLAGTTASATLDVYVSYELEVNVDASLTPKIDDLNTEGPVGVRCEVQ